MTGSGTLADRDVDDGDVLVVIGRPTFDLNSAAPMIEQAVSGADPSTHVVADGRVLQSPEEVSTAMATAPATARSLIVLFASFTDSRLAAGAVAHFDRVDHIVLWSLPEEWSGGRLLRNSLCGANLAAHRLRRDGRVAVNLHEAPGPASLRSIEQRIIDSDARAGRTPFESGSAIRPRLSSEQGAAVERALAELQTTNLGVFGDAPDGFEPCEVEVSLLPQGVQVERVDVDDLFAAARRPLAVSDQALVSDLRDLPGNGDIDRASIERSVGLQSGASRLAGRHGWNALAVRCWPECFDEYGSAACAAMAGLNDQGLPAACEADVFGALTMRLMQSLADGPSFLADLVDVELTNDRLAFWHCGVAPPSMADPSEDARLGLHSNRQVPLVYDFALAPGPLTIARLSQASGELRMVVGEGDVVPGQPFVGTSCVVQLATSARAALDTLFDEGLEHHFALVPGHHRLLVEEVAAELGLPVVALS